MSSGGTSTAAFPLGKTGDAEFDRLPRDEITRRPAG